MYLTSDLKEYVRISIILYLLNLEENESSETIENFDF